MSVKGQHFFSGRRIHVLGAGYLGRAVVEHCLAMGAHVTALSRNAESCGQLRALGIRVLQAELASDSWHEAAGPADFVLVCVGGGGGGPEAYRDSYVGGLASVRRWLARFPADTLVYTSSTSVYPQGDAQVVTEDMPVAALGEDGPGLLVQAENSIQGFITGLRRSFVLRLAGIYGPGRHGFLDRLRDKPEMLPGESSGHLNVIHRDDIVSAVLACWSAPASVPGQVFNLADEGRATRGEIAAWLARRVGISTTHFTGALTPGRRRLTPDRIVSADRIRGYLGWRPEYPSFREGYESLLRGS